MANTKKTIAVLALIAAVGTAGYLIYSKFIKGKKNNGSEPEPDASQDTSAPTTVTRPVVTGAIPGKYITDSSKVLQAGSYGRKIAELQVFMKYVAKVPVTIDGKLGSQTIGAFNRVADNIKTATGIKPTLTLNTINYLKTWSVNTFGFKNYEKMLTQNSDYQKVTEKYSS